MASSFNKKYTAVDFTKVKLNDPFWAPRMEINRTVTLTHQYDELVKTGRIRSFDPEWMPEGENKGRHIFYDSDVAKWIEAASYSLATHPDPGLEKKIDETVEIMRKSQLPDGYLNSWYVNVEKGKQWTNLLENHELYCAGHLIEAAVAYYKATGKRNLLDMIIRYTDHIDSVFGPEPEKKHGYCGHEEIELALVKLYRVTGEKRYLKLSQYFVDERGKKPCYFDIEAEARGVKTSEFYNKNDYEYCQAHLPVREQTRAVGHAVRAMYLYSAMADLAGELGDESLLNACNKIWQNLIYQRMYITGGIGSTHKNEGFSDDYDLPNETAYAETCANIGLVFWNHRLLQLDCDSKYADVMERALYNGVISGVSLDGKSFFYPNPLASRGDYERSEWFGCACCPPNIARLIASIGQYIYSHSECEAVVHLYAQGEGQMNVCSRNLKIKQTTNYPWEGRVKIELELDGPAEFGIRLRIPGWCRTAEIQVNNSAIDIASIMDKGYAVIKREWQSGDVIALNFPMPVERMYSHPNVRENFNCVAIQRGPVVYCIEEIDNPSGVWKMALPGNSQFSTEHKADLLGGVTVVTAEALAASDEGWEMKLYSTEPPKMVPAKLTAVPYCVWANRGKGAMRVWIPKI